LKCQICFIGLGSEIILQQFGHTEPQIPSRDWERRVSENAFGIMSAKFRMCHTTLCAKPDNTVVIVNAALLLHNFLLKKCPSIFAPVGSLDHPNDQGEIIDGDWKQSTDHAGAFASFPSTGCNHLKSAIDIRDCLSHYVNGTRTSAMAMENITAITNYWIFRLWLHAFHIELFVIQ
jgi:hypothetical protein